MHILKGITVQDGFIMILPSNFMDQWRLLDFLEPCCSYKGLRWWKIMQTFMLYYSVWKGIGEAFPIPNCVYFLMRALEYAISTALKIQFIS